MDLITPDFGVIFWQSLIILTVIIVLRKFAWGPIMCVIQQREDKIADSLEKAEQANQLVKELEKRKSTILTEANVEKSRILSEAISAKKSFIAEAKLEADSLAIKAIERNRLEIEEDKKFARIALKEEIASAAIQLTERLLRSQISNKEQSNELIHGLLNQAGLR